MLGAENAGESETRVLNYWFINKRLCKCQYIHFQLQNIINFLNNNKECAIKMFRDSKYEGVPSF